MSCANVRAVISALLDGESVEAGQKTAIAEHVTACRDCAQWRDRAAALTEDLRAEYEATPDLTEPVLAAVVERARSAAADRATARAGRRRLLRWAVGVAAVVQLALAIPAMLTAAGVTTLDAVHPSREMASFDIAVAVGFLLAAIKPERARAFVPVAVALSICLGVTSFMDVSTGLTGLADEAGHMVALLQACLLWALGRVSDTPSAAIRPVIT